MKSSVTIVLDQPGGIYKAGDIISGHVAITLTHEVKVKAIVVNFNGHAWVSWSEKKSYTKGASLSVSRHNMEEYLDHSIVLARKDILQPFSLEEDGVNLPEGESSYQFEYKLPLVLPSSIEGKWGMTKYTIKVTLERPWKFDIEKERDINVIGRLDLNEDFEIARAIGGVAEFNTGLTCCSQGPVAMEMRIHRRGFVAGEMIPFHVEIENNSGRKLYDVTVALIQHVVFRAENKTKKVTHTITSLNKGAVLPGKTENWEGDSLQLPPRLPPSTPKNCRLSKIIQIKYTVTLYVCYSTWESDYAMPVTVIIGTEPLAEAAISNCQKIERIAPTPRLSIARVQAEELITKHHKDKLLKNQGLSTRQSAPILLATSHSSPKPRRNSDMTDIKMKPSTDLTHRRFGSLTNDLQTAESSPRIVRHKQPSKPPHLEPLVEIPKYHHERRRSAASIGDT